jgi:hypothetical protein
MIGWPWLIVAFLAGIVAWPVTFFLAGRDEQPRERIGRAYRRLSEGGSRKPENPEAPDTRVQARKIAGR